MLLLKTKARRARFWWHLTFAFLARYRLQVAAVLIAFAVLATLIYRILPHVFRSNVISVGYVGQFSLENIPADVLYLATKSLVIPDKSGRAVPDLASHWTVSDDKKKYIVFLKDNLKWHDDSPVVARDISLAITNVKVTALNNKAIEFDLPNPISSFPLALNKPVFKAKSFYGTGEFRIVGIDEVNDAVKRISLQPKNHNLPRVEIKFYQSEEQAMDALKIGDIKSLATTGAQNFENWPNLNLEKSIDDSEIVSIFYDTQDPDLGSKEIRQALSYALTRTSFDGHLATSPISESSWAYNDGVKKYEYNPSKTKELLSKANAEKLKLTLSYTADLEKLAGQIGKDWNAVGIEVNLKLEKTLPKNFQVLLAVDKVPPDPDQYALWHSTQKDTNITHYKNVKIDKLLEDARATTDEQKRKELYFDFQKFLVEDAPATFLYHPYRYRVNYKNIEYLLAKLPK